MTLSMADSGLKLEISKSANRHAIMSEINGAPQATLQAFLELTRDLTESSSLEQSLGAITSAALRLLPCDHASVRLIGTANSGLLSAARAGVGAAHPPVAFATGEGVMGWAVEHEQSVRIDDVREDDRFVGSAEQGFTIRSLLVEPLWAGGKVVGVLSVSSASTKSFSGQDSLVARLLANCSVPPIERARLERIAITDHLTLAYNHRYLAPRLYEEMARSRRSGDALSLLLLDLDHFKNVNDIYGHGVGDEVLRVFADKVRAEVRRSDVLVRRGGEEFILLMPRADAITAAKIAERLRQAVSAVPIRTTKGVIVEQTVSIGAATWDGSESAERFEHRADAAMYEAKARGRNIVMFAETPLPPRVASDR